MLPDALRIRKEWIISAEDKERALARRHVLNVEIYNANTKALLILQ